MSEEPGLEGSEALDDLEVANQRNSAQEPQDGSNRANLVRRLSDMTAYIQVLEQRYFESLNKTNNLLGTIEQIKVERDKLQRILDHEQQAGRHG